MVIAARTGLADAVKPHQRAAEIAAADDYNHAIAIHHLGGNIMNFPDAF